MAEAASARLHPRAYASVVVGERFELLCDPVTTRQLVMYAGASGDFNRIHYDQAFAVEAGLGGVIAHGMLTMALAGRCVTAWGGPGAVVREISGRFLSPVRPGDAVSMVAEVTGKAERDGAACCDLVLAGTVGERSVFQGAATMVLKS